MIVTVHVYVRLNLRHLTQIVGVTAPRQHTCREISTNLAEHHLQHQFWQCCNNAWLCTSKLAVLPWPVEIRPRLVGWIVASRQVYFLVCPYFVRCLLTLNLCSIWFDNVRIILPGSSKQNFWDWDQLEQIVYSSDGLPFAQTVLSNHWRELKAHIVTILMFWTSSFFNSLTDGRIPHPLCQLSSSNAHYSEGKQKPLDYFLIFLTFTEFMCLPVENWVVGCWRGCLSGARCRFAYGPANATAIHCLLLQ